MLHNELRRLSTDFGRLVREVSAQRSAAPGIQTLWEEFSALKTQITARFSEVSTVTNPRVTETTLRFREASRFDGIGSFLTPADVGMFLTVILFL
jgi:hypothetical protein